MMPVKFYSSCWFARLGDCGDGGTRGRKGEGAFELNTWDIHSYPFTDSGVPM